MAEYKTACPKCREDGGDAKGDNLHFYGEGKGAYCFACGYTELSDDEKEARGIGLFEWTDEMEEEVSNKEPLTKEEIEKIKGYTTTNGYKVRSIPDWAYAAYYVRHKVDVQTGEPVEQYYPIFKDNHLTGFKVRQLPKTFYTVGSMSSESDLFGQYRFRTSNSKKILITAGEVDAISAYAMLNKPDSEYDPTPVVSAVVGETASFRQLKNHYEWLNRFEQVIVLYDNDKAGQDAVKKLVDVIPKGKMFVMNIDMKDANEMLMAGKERQFVNAFIKSKQYVPQGIAGSSSFLDAVIKEAHAPRIEFPSFMKKFNNMTAGGPALGTIGLISAFTGAAKSTIVNECCYHWLMSGQLRVGVISMEQNLGQYSELVLSRHIGVKLGALPKEDKIKLLEEQWVIDKAEELFKEPDGSDRWYVIDDRDCHIDVMKRRIEQLIVQCECQIIVWDTISDSFDMLTVDEQAQLMMWMKGIVTNHPVSFILIAHQRKVGTGEKDGSQGGIGTESGVQGSSTLVKSAAWIVIASRDKMNEDPIIRNTTNLFMPKNRGAGTTGECGKLFYDAQTHSLYDFDEWSSKQDVSF